MELRGATVLITGASSGIGAATARVLAAVGADLVLAGRDAARLGAVAEATGGRPVIAELTDPRGPAELAEQAGDVDVLVANAGGGYAGDFAEMPDEALGELIELNLTAQLRLTRALLPGMLRRGRGHLVYVGSIAAVTGVRGEAAYSAAKAGVAVFADALRQEVAGHGVRVSSVLPGVVDTPFFSRRGAPYDRTRPKPIPAERVALAIRSAVRHDRAELFVPAWLRLPARVKGTAPALYRTLATRFG